jgi:hypothetical protein
VGLRDWGGDNWDWIYSFLHERKYSHEKLATMDMRAIGNALQAAAVTFGIAKLSVELRVHRADGGQSHKRPRE